MSDSDGGWSWDDEQAAQQEQLAADLAARTTAPTQEIAQAAANAAISYTPPAEQAAPAEQTASVEQAAPWSPPQEQAPAATPAPATVAPLTAVQQDAIAKAWIPTVSGGGGDSGASTPVLFNTITGETKSADPVMGANSAPLVNYDISGLTSHINPNFEGTPTEFGNDQGTQAILTRLGIEPISNYNLVLNPGEKPSSTTAIQGTDSQNQLLWMDENGQPTSVNTGTPYISGTLADKIMLNKPAKDVGVFDPNFVNALETAAVMALSAGAGGALLGGVGAADAAAATAALTDAGLSTSQIAALGAEYGTGSAAAAGAAASTSGLPTLVTEAAKSAALNAGITAVKGGSPADILKAGLVGAASGGIGSAISDAGLGALGTTVAKGATQAGLTALTGGNVANSLLSSAIGAVIPIALDSALPDGMLDSLPKPIVDAITSATAKAVAAAATNGDVSSAALNSIIGSAAGAATDYATDAAGLKGLTVEQAVDKIGNQLAYTFDTSGAKDNPEQQQAGAQTPPLTQPDVVNSIFQQDAQDVINRNPPPPPLVQAAIDQNTPKTVADVVTPPLIQQAMSQPVDTRDPDAVYNKMIAELSNPQPTGGALTSLASNTAGIISDAPITTSDQIPISKILEVWQQTHPDATISDLNFQDFVKTLPGYERTYFANPTGDVVISPSSVSNDEEAPAGYHYVTDTSGGVSVKFLEANVPTDAPLSSTAPFEVGFKPQLPAEEYAPMLDALNKAGETVTQKNLEDITQDPAKFVSRAFQAFLGRPPTSSELANYVDQYSESHNTSPQDLLKNIYDQIKREFTVSLESEPVTPAPVVTPTPTPQPPLTPTPVAPVKTPTASASSPSQGNNQTAGGQGTGGAGLAGNEGAPGAVSPSGAAPLTAVQTTAQANAVAVDAANSDQIPATDIPIVAQKIADNSNALGVSPAQAVANNLITPDGSLTGKGVEKIADATGLSPSDIIEIINGSTTARTGTGSGITSTGAGATTGAETGAAPTGPGIGGSTGTNIGGLGTGTGTGVGPGAGTGTGDGLGDGLGTGTGTGSGTGTSGAGTGGVKAVVAPAATAQPSYSYSGAGTQGTTVGALPGNLQATYLQGVNVNEYNPFENYDVYQQLAPVHAKDGGSPLQLAQLQQGIYGVDPSLYGVLQKRAAPNYFTYGTDASGGNPTTFAGSQLQGKPTPNIPVIPTGKTSGADWLYQGSGTNPLAMAGTGIPSLGAGTMAQGGQAQGGEGEHIPEFITGTTGHYVRGRGDGQSDDIPAMLADGEYVFDASTVSTLGNGSSDAGAKLLDAFRESLRDHTRSAPADKIPPKASPLEYMKEALQHVGRK